jgi:hypothetical protein
MELQLRFTQKRAVVAVLVLALISAGVAYATIPDGSGAIHGCYTKKGGVLTVIDPSAGQGCSSFQTPITWNQQGPKGDPGPQGPQGDPGPSDAYVVQAFTAPLTQDWASVAHLDLPYGAYVATAVVNLWNAAAETSPIYVICEIDAPGSGGNVGLAFTEIPRDTYSQASLTLLGSIRSGGPVDVDCRATVGFGTTVTPSDASSQFVTLSATRVGDLH